MKERIVFIDFVRVFACFLVMIVHASENFYPGPESTDMAGPVAMLANETNRLWVSVYDGFSRMSVPLFMIVSAFLLAPMKDEETSWNFYKRRFKRIIPPFIIFSVLYSTLPLIWGQINVDTCIKDLMHIPLNFTTLAGHFWFMFPLISLYLFIPIISPWLNKCTRNEELLFVILFLISTCIPFLNRLFGEVWGQCFWNQYHMLWYFSGYLGYLVMAHYIKSRMTWSKCKKIITGSTMVVLGAIATILSFYIQAIPGQLLNTPELEIGWSFCTLNVVCMTFGAFILFSCIEMNNTPKIILELSNLSFGIFLMHIFWLHLFAIVFIEIYPIDTFLSIPVIAISTFATSAITSKLISYLPISKWIIGY